MRKKYNSMLQYKCMRIFFNIIKLKFIAIFKKLCLTPFKNLKRKGGGL